MNAKLSARLVTATEWVPLSMNFADLGFEQGLTYAHAAAQRIGAKLEFWAVEQNGRPIAAAAVRIKTIPGLGGGIAWIASGPLVVPTGYVLPDVDTLAAIFATLRAEITGRRGYILRFRLSGTAFASVKAVTAAAIAAGFVPTGRAPAYRSFAVAAQEAPDATMNRFHGKWRGHLRSALKSGMSLERGCGPEFEARFLQLFDAVKAAKGFEQPDISPQFHFALSGPDYFCETLISTKDGEDLAAIVIGGSGPTIVYLFGATAETGRRLRAGYFLAWEGIARTREIGRAWYDLGGVDFEANPSVAEFKERTNGHPILSEVFEARPAGPVGALLSKVETLHVRLKSRKWPSG